MILVIDIGNTNITLGIFDEDGLCFEARLSTDRYKTKYEYTVELSALLSVYGVEAGKIDGAIISSVVPQITLQLSEAVFQVTKTKPLVVGPGIKTGLNIKIDDPATLGADLVVGCVAALSKYETPCIICDLGTATKIMVLDKNGSLRGGAIMPGVAVSLDALVSNTSLLQSISFDAPGKVIGTNTADSMKSGSVFGTASMIDGMCDRIEEELEERCCVIATGGLAGLVVGHCRRSIDVCETLVLEGLKIIYSKNTQ